MGAFPVQRRQAPRRHRRPDRPPLPGNGNVRRSLVPLRGRPVPIPFSQAFPVHRRLLRRAREHADIGRPLPCRSQPLKLKFRHHPSSYPLDPSMGAFPVQRRQAPRRHRRPDRPPLPGNGNVRRSLVPLRGRTVPIPFSQTFPVHRRLLRRAREHADTGRLLPCRSQSLKPQVRHRHQGLRAVAAAASGSPSFNLRTSKPHEIGSPTRKRTLPTLANVLPPRLRRPVAQDPDSGADTESRCPAHRVSFVPPPRNATSPSPYEPPPPVSTSPKICNQPSQKPRTAVFAPFPRGLGHPKTACTARIPASTVIPRGSSPAIIVPSR